VDALFAGFDCRLHVGVSGLFVHGCFTFFRLWVGEG
jgi:hypothetical protein